MILRLKTCCKKLIASSVLALSFDAHASSVLDLASLVASADLVASDLCATYAEQVLVDRLLELTKTRIASPSHRMSAEQIARMLAGFDQIASSLCESTRVAVREEQSALVTDFAKYYAIPLDAEWSRFLSTPQARQWAIEDSSLSTETKLLTALYRLVQELRPETFAPALQVSTVLQLTIIADSNLKAEYVRTTKGLGDLAYRRMVTLMLSDAGFLAIIPPRYQPQRLATRDIELRRTGARWTRLGEFPSFESLESVSLRTNSAMEERVAPKLAAAHSKAIQALSELVK